MRRIGRRVRIAFLSGVAAGMGCRTTPAPIVRPDPIPVGDAVRVVNQNTARISATLRAAGDADGYFTDPEGRRRSFHLNGVLFYLAPRSLRFDLKSFGERQVLVGSNGEWYWFGGAEEDSYVCVRHGRDSEAPPDMPVRADQMIEALGLGGIQVSGDAPGLVQRVEQDHQQVLFLDRDRGGGLTLTKEYWLDRFPPRLIRRVLFRDAIGALLMESRLDDYRAISAGGPILPHEMTASWPHKGTQMRFRIAKWSFVEQVHRDGPQFATPPACLGAPSSASPHLSD